MSYGDVCTRILLEIERKLIGMGDVTKKDEIGVIEKQLERIA
jgi:hypothetical protein